MKVDKSSGTAEIALAEGVAARGNPPDQDLSSAVLLTESERADSECAGVSQTVCCKAGGIGLTAVTMPTHDNAMPFLVPMTLLLEEKVIERDWVASMIANIYAAIDHLEEYIGSGNAKYLLLAVLVLVLILLARRRR